MYLDVKYIGLKGVHSKIGVCSFCSFPFPPKKVMSGVMLHVFRMYCLNCLVVVWNDTLLIELPKYFSGVLTLFSVCH